MMERKTWMTQNHLPKGVWVQIPLWRPTYQWWRSPIGRRRMLQGHYSVGPSPTATTKDDFNADVTEKLGAVLV